MLFRSQQQRSRDPQAVVLVESAVLFEAGQHRRFDKIIVVWCTPEQQVERYMQRSPISKEDVARRMAAQIPGEEKRKMADFVIDTSKTLADTERNVNEVFQALQVLAAESAKAKL